MKKDYAMEHELMRRQLWIDVYKKCEITSSHKPKEAAKALRAFDQKFAPHNLQKSACSCKTKKPLLDKKVTPQERVNEFIDSHTEMLVSPRLDDLRYLENTASGE